MRMNFLLLVHKHIVFPIRQLLPTDRITLFCLSCSKTGYSNGFEVMPKILSKTFHKKHLTFYKQAFYLLKFPHNNSITLRRLKSIIFEFVISYQIDAEKTVICNISKDTTVFCMSVKTYYI